MSTTRDRAPYVAMASRPFTSARPSCQRVAVEESASVSESTVADWGKPLWRRLLTAGVLAGAIAALLAAVPALSGVASEITHMDRGWVVLAGFLELASCASFVAVFQNFFSTVSPHVGRRLAWTEMGSGALLPGGGIGSLALGGWLLHLVGMPTREILRRSSGLFFFTSAMNVAALVIGGLLLASGLSSGPDTILLAGAPIAAGASAVTAALWVARPQARRSRGEPRVALAAELLDGIGDAKRALRHPDQRLAGAIGYLGFDIAVLWATLTAVGYSPSIAVLILGYIIGYIGNLIPVPGGIGVLETGLVGTLVLYGAPFTEATGGVLVYHAIAFWLPSLGGLLGFRLLRGELTTPTPEHTTMDEPPTSDDASFYTSRAPRGAMGRSTA